MLIGKIAAAANVTIATIRFYERRGLLPSPVRRASGFREYPDDAVEQVRFIKNAQALGFTLEEIAELLRLRQQTAGNAAEALALARARLQAVEEKISRLQTMRKELRQLIAACDCQSGATDCVLLAPAKSTSTKRRS